MRRFIESGVSNIDNGALNVVQAWDQLHAAWLSCDLEILSILRSVNKSIIKGTIGQNLFAIKAEEALAEQAPDAFNAVNGLRKAITFLDGKDIQWWHLLGPKPVRRMESDIIEGIVEGYSMVENGYAYGRCEGKVLGSEVGFNNVFLNMGIWLEVEHSTPSPYKIRHPFEAMFGIEFIPQ